MSTDLDTRFRDALAAVGDRRRWYQTGYFFHYPAVALAVHGAGGDGFAPLKRDFSTAISTTDSLRYIESSLAAIASARGLPADPIVASIDAAEDRLRSATRLKGARRVAAAIVAVQCSSDLEAAADGVNALYEAWNREHRMMTGADDLSLAAVMISSGLDVTTAVDRARFALAQLAVAGYRSHWDVARLLALAPVTSTLERFLWLADELRGRRRKPLTQRRPSLAMAALAHHPLHELAGVLRDRVAMIRRKRLDPDPDAALEIAALLTIGESAASDPQLGVMFDGLLLRSIYIRAKRDAD